MGAPGGVLALWVDSTLVSVGCGRGNVTTGVVESNGGKAGVRHDGVIGN